MAHLREALECKEQEDRESVLEEKLSLEDESLNEVNASLESKNPNSENPFEGNCWTSPDYICKGESKCHN